MKKLFISQPMRGKTNDEIMAVRERAVESAKKYASQEWGDEEIEVIDSFFKDTPHDASPLWYLGRSIQLLAEADIAYFAYGWDDARGCVIENECALQYDVPLVIEDYRDSGRMYTHKCRENGRIRIHEEEKICES